MDVPWKSFCFLLRREGEREGPFLYLLCRDTQPCAGKSYRNNEHEGFGGIVPGLGGGQQKVFFFCFSAPALVGKRKTHKQNPQKSQDNPGRSLFMCFVLWFLFALRQGQFRTICDFSHVSFSEVQKKGLEGPFAIGSLLHRITRSKLRSGSRAQKP